MSQSSSARGVPTTTERDLVVVDASVLVELVIDGRHARGADVLMSRYVAPDGIAFVSAAHGLVEATNALRKLVFRGALTAEDALAAVTALGDLDLALDTTSLRLRRIWSLRDSMSAYDAAYAAAAEALNAPLVSVDERLRRACRDAGIATMGLNELASPS